MRETILEIILSLLGLPGSNYGYELKFISVYVVKYSFACIDD